MMERIEDAADPRLDPYRLLSEPARVAESTFFFAEGRRLVAAVLARPRYVLDSVVATSPAALALGAPLARRPDVALWLVEPHVLEEVAGWHFHQGCLAAAYRPEARTTSSLVAGLEGLGPVVVLDEVANPDNVGAIFRSARALGASGVVLSPGSASPLYRKALRASMGSALDLPFAHGAEAWELALRALEGAGLECVALDATDDAVPLPRWLAGRQRHMRVALALGAEDRGLRPATRRVFERRVRIPMVGGHDSLNVAAAAAIALHALGCVPAASDGGDA